MKPRLVHIDWKDPSNDWPWFYLQEINGQWVRLKGADYPDGTAKHQGDVFWAHYNDIKIMRDCDED